MLGDRAAHSGPRKLHPTTALLKTRKG